MNNHTSDKHFSKRVSFIYITKNRKKLFEETLLKLKNIKEKNDEIIVINGGETEINVSDIDGYIKRIENGKTSFDEEVDIEEIVQRPELQKKIRKPKVVPIPQKDAV